RLQINKQIFLDPEFEQLWEKIKFRTAYQVEYDTGKLIRNCVEAIVKMEKINPVKVNYREAQLELQNKGITLQQTRVNYQTIKFQGGLPDIIAYLQKQTELTRK